MALAISSSLITLASQSSNTTNSTLSFTPTAGSLLIVGGLLGAASGTYTNAGISDFIGDSGGTSWTNIGVQVSSGGSFYSFINYRKVGTGPGSGTVTLTPTVGTNTIRWLAAVYEVTGYDTTTPVQQSTTNSNGGSGTTSITGTLGASPAASSLVFGICGTRNESSGITEDGAFTELNDFSTSGSAPLGRMQAQYDNGGADTTVDWSWTTGGAAACVAIEINVAAGGAPSLRYLTLLGVG